MINEHNMNVHVETIHYVNIIDIIMLPLLYQYHRSIVHHGEYASSLHHPLLSLPSDKTTAQTQKPRDVHGTALLCFTADIVAKARRNGGRGVDGAFLSKMKR